MEHISSVESGRYGWDLGWCVCVWGGQYQKLRWKGERERRRGSRTDRLFVHLCVNHVLASLYTAPNVDTRLRTEELVIIEFQGLCANVLFKVYF